MSRPNRSHLRKFEAEAAGSRLRLSPAKPRRYLRARRQSFLRCAMVGSMGKRRRKRCHIVWRWLGL